MITPIMITNIGWGTYCFFAVMNACFIPIIWFFYPETKKRSLEEIDLIFAKGYLENISYVKAAQDMPYLTDREVEAMAREYGFVDQDEEFKIGEKDDGHVTGDAHHESRAQRSDSDTSVDNAVAVEQNLERHTDHAGHEGFRNDNRAGHRRVVGSTDHPAASLR
jgi:hypothetical protein